MSQPYDVLIKHGRIIDGTGSKGYEADIGIGSGQVVFIKENIGFDMIAEEGNNVNIILFAMDEQDICRILKTPFTMIGSDGGPKIEQTFFHPRFTGTFPRVLDKYTREDRILSLEEAVYKMTSLPAKTFQLRTKGAIKSGFDADIVIFDPKKIRDRSTFKHPSRKPEGIEYVIVNGTIAVAHGELTGRLAGKVLRKSTA